MRPLPGGGHRDQSRLLGEKAVSPGAIRKVIVCLLGPTAKQHGPDAQPNDAAPRSLAAVLDAIEKTATPATPKEQ